MTSVDQQAFLNNLRRALGDVPPEDRAGPAEDTPPRHAGVYQPMTQPVSRTREEQMALLERLIQESEPINLKVAVHRDIPSVAKGIRRLAVESRPEWGDKKQVAAWNHPLIVALDLPAVLKEAGIPVKFTERRHEGEREEPRQWIFESYIGITSADFCLAESATLVLKTRAGQDRSVSLVPSIHIAVIGLEQILGSLKELYFHLKNDPDHAAEGLTPCLTLITGPSKTADIEATMVHGAHGPREVHLFVVTG